MTPIFFLYCDIKAVFETFNNELPEIRQWFIANRLSLNTEKKTQQNIHFFHENPVKDNILLKLPDLQVAKKPDWFQ